MTLYDVEAALEYVEPPIWRVLRVRGDTTLLHLHCALQVAFDWWDLGLFYFEVGGREFGPPEAGAFPDDAGAFTIDEVLEAEEEPDWSYGYFPAEEALWEAGLFVQPAGPGTAEAEDAPAAVCVDGGGAAPLDELDGPFGHMDTDTAASERVSPSQGGNGAGPDRAAGREPDAFDPGPVNERLRLLETAGWDAVFNVPEEDLPDERSEDDFGDGA